MDEDGGQVTAAEELEAMKVIAETLDGLNDDAVRARVLRWSAERYHVASARLPAAGQRDRGSAIPGDGGVQQFEDLASLWDAADPRTEGQRALVVGYYFQKIKGQSDFDSQAVNSELKQAGYAAANITKTFTRLMISKPRLIHQTRKSGSTRQARKRYILTSEGIRAVERMIASAGEKEE